MKYGYMNYRKHLLVNKNERPMNLGDPIQSLAVLELYKEIGIPEEDIVPLDRYDLVDYVGEDVVAIVNGAENYEHFCYATRFLPVSGKIHPVFIGLHFHRILSEDELNSLRNNQPVGCRDECTVKYLKSKGIDAFLTGCLTMLFPRRSEGKKYNKVFIVDCPESILEHIPNEIKESAEYLSQVVRIHSHSDDHRLTMDETDRYNEKAREQLNRYRDEARLIITTRLHVASPCAAMGIPVVLVRDTYDERYQFIDRFLPLYYPKGLDVLDFGSVSASIPEEVKRTLTDISRSMLETVKQRVKLNAIYSNKFQNIDYFSEEEIAVQKLPMNPMDSFEYCIWGVCMPNSYLLYVQMAKHYHNARLKYAIDTYATGIYKDNIRIIHPNDIEKLVNKKTWIFVVAPAAHETAHRMLLRNYSFALIKGTVCKTFEKL